MKRGPLELVHTFPAVFCMFGSSNFNSFYDVLSVTVQLRLCGTLPQGLVQYCSQHSFVCFQDLCIIVCIQGVEEKCGIIFISFFFHNWFVQFGKKRDINNFMITSNIEALFSLKFTPIWVSKRRNIKESMVCLTPKSSQKKSEIIGVSLWPPTSPDINPLD